MPLVEEDDQLVSLSFLFDFSDSFILSFTLILVVYLYLISKTSMSLNIHSHQCTRRYCRNNSRGFVQEVTNSRLCDFNVFDVLSVLFNCCFFLLLSIPFIVSCKLLRAAAFYHIPYYNKHSSYMTNHIFYILYYLFPEV